MIGENCPCAIAGYSNLHNFDCPISKKESAQNKRIMNVALLAIAFFVSFFFEGVVGTVIRVFSIVFLVSTFSREENPNSRPLFSSRRTHQFDHKQEVNFNNGNRDSLPKGQMGDRGRLGDSLSGTGSQTHHPDTSRRSSSSPISTYKGIPLYPTLDGTGSKTYSHVPPGTTGTGAITIHT